VNIICLVLDNVVVGCLATQFTIWISLYFKWRWNKL